MSIKLEPHNRIGYEEKLNLMLEYLESIKGTNETFSHSTVYKGYNIGTMRANLRASYWNGTLKIEKRLLEKFKESGIITERPGRIRASVQEKCDFLISMIGKSEEEIKQAKMESGLTYSEAKYYIQNLYNKGKLNIEPEQIEFLQQNGILNLSTQERENIENQYGIPQKHIKKIVKKFGSLEEFIEKYKKGECEYDFKDDAFVGSRALTVSEKDITVAQKKAYVNLIEELFRNINATISGQYINIDAVDKAIDELKEVDKDVIKTLYGLDTGESVKTVNIAHQYHISVTAVSMRIAKITRILRGKLGLPYNKVIICAEEGIDEEISNIQKKEETIRATEEILMFLYENDESRDNICLKELGWHVDNKLIEELEFNRYPIKDVGDMRFHIDSLEYYLGNFYSNLSEKVQHKEEIQARKKRQQEFMEIYAQVKEEYLNKENIFDRDYLINGRTIKNITPVQKRPKKKCIDELQLPIKAMVYLHHNGINTIDDLISDAHDIKDVEEFLSSIKGLDDIYKEEIVEKLAHGGYMNQAKKAADAKQAAAEVMPIEELKLSNNTYNALKRRGIENVKDILEFYYKDDGWIGIWAIKNLGQKGRNELFKILEIKGFIKDGKPFGLSTDLEQEGSLNSNIKNTNLAGRTLPETKLEDMGLSVRTYNALKRFGVNSMSELLEKIQTEDDLIRVKYMGTKCRAEIIDKVHSLGYKFKYEIEQELEDEKVDDEIVDNQEDVEQVLKNIEEHQRELKMLKEEIVQYGMSLDDTSEDALPMGDGR